MLFSLKEQKFYGDFYCEPVLLTVLIPVLNGPNTPSRPTMTTTFAWTAEYTLRGQQSARRRW